MPHDEAHQGTLTTADELGPPRCLGCAYVLIGLPGLTCPECGRADEVVAIVDGAPWIRNQLPRSDPTSGAIRARSAGFGPLSVKTSRKISRYAS